MTFFTSLPVTLQTVLLLLTSNVFMTFAWYGHLRNMSAAPWYAAAMVSWGFSVGQLKIMQEVITLTVFVPFAVFYLKEPFKLDYLWAALCMVGAVYFIFRSG